METDISSKDVIVDVNNTNDIDNMIREFDDVMKETINDSVFTNKNKSNEKNNVNIVCDEFDMKNSFKLETYAIPMLAR